MSYPTLVANRVIAKMRQVDATELGLANETGIARTTLGRRLAGVTPFTVLELWLIADALGCDVAELTNVDGEAAA